ncbi:MAG TPA: hypothetical protein VGS04_03795 [Nitrososphaerales archaeon]|nr:hypothetical protein [Nitrososphaerales archaeon]
MPRLEAGVLALLVLSCLAAVPAGRAFPLPAVGGCPPAVIHCEAPPYAVPAAPVWATLNALGYGNYPGGNEEFAVFFVNSDSPPLGNVTLLDETLTTPFRNASVSGLPVELAPGQTMLSSIYLQIPADFANSNFTASVTIDFHIANGNASTPNVLTGTAHVFMLGPPIMQFPSTSTTSTQQATMQNGTVSGPLFYAGVGIPSIIVVVLFALLVRGRRSLGSASSGTPVST